MLHILPSAGLANRMRVLASHLQLAHEIQIPVNILWYKNWAMRADFLDLFEPIEGVTFEKLQYYSWWSDSTQSSIGDFSWW